MRKAISPKRSSFGKRIHEHGQRFSVRFFFLHTKTWLAHRRARPIARHILKKKGSTVMKKATIISIHVVLQLIIYCGLSYFHLWGFLLTRVIPEPPVLTDFLYMHSVSPIASILVAIIFTLIWRGTWKLNLTCTIASFSFIILYTIFIWTNYYH